MYQHDSTQTNQIQAILNDLNTRTARLLRIRRINDVERFLSLSEEEMLRWRNWGRTTVAEIQLAQTRLGEFVADIKKQGGSIYSGSIWEITHPRVPNMAVSLLDPEAPYPSMYNDNQVRSRSIAVDDTGQHDSAEAEQIRAILGNLTTRAINLLRMYHINHLERFLDLGEEEMLSWKNCGRTTVVDIQRAQARFRELVASTNKQGGPIYRGNIWEMPQPSTMDTVALQIDPEAPYPSLVYWLSRYCSSPEMLKVFLLRNGMLGEHPRRLSEIGKDLGKSRSHVGQMNQRVANKFSRRQPALEPLVRRAQELVEANGGSIHISELVLQLLVRGPGGEMLRHAGPLIELLAGQSSWIEAGLEIPENTSVITQAPNRNQEDDTPVAVSGPGSEHESQSIPG